jgi:hypothetical protein
MNRTLPLSLAGVASLLACVSALHAQDPIVMQTWSFTEVYAGTNMPVANPNGIIEPGEAARIEMSVSFTPSVGTILPLGTVAGLSFLACDLAGLNMAEGTWSHIMRADGWVFGHPGSPNPAGTAVHNIFAGQFVWPPGSIANPQNPIDMIWWGVWTPDTFTARTTIFESMGTSPLPTAGSSSLIIQTGTLTGGGPEYSTLPANLIFGSVHIPIIPAPGSVFILGIGAAAALRRRR